MAFFSSFVVTPHGGFAAEIGYTVAKCGKKKCARFRFSSGSPFVPDEDEFCVGRRRESRESEKNDCCGGGGFLRIDFPGRGMITADDDGELHDGDAIPAGLTGTWV